MKKFLLISALAACFSMAWAFGNECSLLQEEESGYCGNPDVNEGKNLCYVLTSVNDVKTLTIYRNPNAVGDDFGIAEDFFSYKDFSVLVIEDGVTSIGQDAFYFCKSLTTVTFPDGLASIGKSAFDGCKSLTTLTFPDGLTSIGESAFKNCSGLTTVTLPDGLTSIGQGAFYCCENLTTVTFPDGLASIGQSAFQGCSGLKTLTLPDGLASIGQGAFCHCDSLTTVTLPEGLDSIGQSAFQGCSGLTTVTFPDDLASIGQSAFQGCSGLKTLTLPDRLTSIGQSAFQGCSGLTTVTFPDGLTSIGQSAFYGCSSLTTLTFPDGLTSIGESAFKYCSGLMTVTFPKGLASIGEGAFYNCSGLTTLAFPDGLNSIGQDAFYGCESLTTVTFPKGLASIGEGAFFRSSGLKTLAFPDGLTSIGESAFYNCTGLTTLTLPSSLTLIDKDAFYQCTGVTDIYCHAVPAKLTWDDNYCDDFKRSKGTRCHVYDEGDWGSFGSVNVTFVGDLPVVLEKNGDNSDLVASPPTKAKDVTLADRVFFTDGSWNTLCLPFSLSSLSGTPLEGFTVKELDMQTVVGGHRTGMEGETLHLYFKDATSIEAGKPYLVKKGESDLLISSDADWVSFAQNVNDGTSYKGKVVRLGADINVSTMAGIPNCPFKGTFDGNGHTINVNLRGGGEGLALFYAIDNATIQNVNVTGTITSTYHRPATFTSFVGGNSTIKNCWSSVNIVSTHNNAWIDGGAFVARVNSDATLNMQDCAFTGSVTYEANTYSGGSMVGFTQTGAITYLTNCLFSPTALALTVKNYNPHVFVSGNVRGNLTNCYYNAVAKESILDNEGIDASNMSTAELATALGACWEVSGDLVLPKFISDIKNPVFHDVTICNVDPANQKVVSNDGKVSFAGSYKPIAGSNQLNLGTGNRLFHLVGGEKMGALHAAFFMGQVNSAGNPVGDVNGDGKVDISDVVMLVNLILNDTSDISDVTDLNGDNSVGIGDVVVLVNKILNSDTSNKVSNVVSNVNITYDSSGSGDAR